MRSTATRTDPEGDLGYPARRFGEWLQAWALRDQGEERAQGSRGFTRNPLSLVRALEKLDADPSNVLRASPAPRHRCGSSSGQRRRRVEVAYRAALGEGLLLDERIERLRVLAGEVPTVAPPPSGDRPAAQPIT